MRWEREREGEEVRWEQGGGRGHSGRGESIDHEREVQSEGG